MSAYVIGLTGGIGSGKSAASDFLSTKGIDIIDADIVAREVVAPGSECLLAIKNRFGDDVMMADGGLDRKALRDIVFSDEQQKQWLNQLLHPAIRTRILQQLEASRSAYVVLAAPLLLENGLDQYCDRVLVIDIPESLQVARTVKRDNSEPQQVEAIMAAQLNRSQRLQKADDVVVNDGDLDNLHQQLNQLDKNYRLAANRSG
ncbi:dephospho-CoA kinase [Idiomarina seosinensis]|uniref:Dephospho-CoA kinase n=1 Tax=Idiomarina seosinensis TaxID=281739 RepID=A0A432ZD85_9GAMM|nr:dephospho-CoA kinase [Idiomarina seosinensis]RUO75871.1 dephospho-CoA kinase [Idiomarina seosinensis]